MHFADYAPILMLGGYILFGLVIALCLSLLIVSNYVHMKHRHEERKKDKE